MADMLRKVMPVEVKAVANKDRVLEIIGSTEDEDRMHDVIRADGWVLKNYKKNPVFMWGHDYSAPPIGRANKVWVEDNKLKFQIEFADAETYEFADTIFRLYKEGFLHATSVGFQPLDWEGKSEENPYPKWEGNVFTKQELYELSAVPVPANPSALVSARDQGVITTKELETFNREVKIAEDASKDVEPEVTDDKESEVEATQAELSDELDYIVKLIESKGMNEDVKEDAWRLVGEIIRLSGGDIPVEIKNLIIPVEPEPETETETLTPEKVQEIVAMEVAKAIRKAQGALE